MSAATALHLQAAQAAGALRAASDMFRQMGRHGATDSFIRHALKLTEAIHADMLGTAPPQPEPIPVPEATESDFGTFLQESQR